VKITLDFLVGDQQNHPEPILPGVALLTMPVSCPDHRTAQRQMITIEGESEL